MVVEGRGEVQEVMVVEGRGEEQEVMLVLMVVIEQGRGGGGA